MSLPCPCPACQGKLVSAYIRHKHMKIFVASRSASSRPDHEMQELHGEQAPGDQVSTPIDEACQLAPMIMLLFP